MTVLLSAAVRVPASTANLGSGFDCVGVAVNRWLSASVSVVPVQGKAPRLTIERAGTLSALDVAPELDLLYAGFVAAYRESDGDEGAGCARHDLSFSATSEIPIARGLGSSAAALVAGAALANRTLDLGLTAGQIIRACSLAEGHPDNVGAAVHGGAVLCVRTSGSELIASPLPVHRRLAFVLATPGFTTSTAAARAVLPRMVTHGVATIAAARGAALVRGLETGDERLLEAALDDVLHVPHRRSLIRGYDEVTSAAVSAGAIGATLSGSGSTVLAITDRSRARAVAEAMRRAWQAVGVEAETFIDRCGTPGLAVDGGVAVRDILLASV